MALVGAQWIINRGDLPWVVEMELGLMYVSRTPYRCGSNRILFSIYVVIISNYVGNKERL